MKKAIIINLFGAPSAGKSTCAAFLFYKMKLAGVNCEYISEFAKDKVWEENTAVFKDQNYIFGKQSFKLSRCADKVDLIITDSPLLLSGFYSDDNCREEREALVLKTFNEYNNLNYFINRTKDYNSAGRHQTEVESDSISLSLKEFLHYNDISFKEYNGDKPGYDKLYLQILKDITESIKFSKASSLDKLFVELEKSEPKKPQIEYYVSVCPLG